MTQTQSTPPEVDRHLLAAQLKQHALDLGFDRAGIAPAAPSAYRDYFRHWLDDGQSGAMDYLTRRFAERTDPAAYLPGARSILCVAMNYFVELPPPDPHPSAPQARIARYALGDDYHDIMKPRLHALADWLRHRAPQAQTKAAVDTAPVMEKELAARAGIGWMGKNTCIIHESLGSWLLLGEVLTTLDLPPDNPALDRCGTCRRCLDACPTGALTAPYQLDARRCISYLNIEHRGPIDEKFHPQLNDWLYGCDICQDVCPWNRQPPPTLQPRLQPRFPAGSIDLNTVLNWTDEDYRRELRHSAMKRVKLPVLQRNAQILQQNR